MTIESITTLDSLLISRSTESPNHRFLIRPVKDTANTAVEEITYGIFDAHVSRLAKAWIAQHVDDLYPKAVVGVFFPSGYTLSAVVFALIRLGVVPFCLSPRNSDEGLKHLVHQGKITMIIASRDNGLASRVKTIFPNDGQLPVQVLEVARDDLADLPSGNEHGRFSFPRLPAGLVSGHDIVIQQHVRPDKQSPLFVRC